MRLIDTEGSVEWLSFPRFDSPSVFGRLLGPDAGHWQHRAERGVDKHPQICRPDPGAGDHLHDANGVLVLTDLLALGPDNGGHRLGIGVPHLLVRRLSCTSGQVEVDISYAPRPEYGLVVPLLASRRRRNHGPRRRRVAGFTTPVGLALEGGTAHGRVTLEAGQTVHLALHRSTLEQTPARVWSQHELARMVEDTVADWQSWSDIHQSYNGPWREQV